MPKAVSTKTTKIAVAKKTLSARPKMASTGDIKVFNTQGKEVGFVDMPQQIRQAKGSDALIAQAVRVYTSRQQIGTKHAKTRGEVSGSTRKIFRQKGTGNARHGSRKAPIFIGGGVAHGPKSKNSPLEMPKTMRRRALFAVLAQQAKSGNILVMNGTESLTGKTKEIALLLSQLYPGTPSTLFVIGDGEEMIVRAGRNLPHVDVTAAKMLHVYTVLAHQKIVITESAMKYFSKTV